MAELTIIIPAWNEGRTIGAVVQAAQAAHLGEVLVVDDGSSDDTAQQAERQGARILRLTPNQGKAAALLAGVQQATTPIVLFLDADLLGLQAKHVQALAAPLLTGEAAASVGLFTGGRRSTTLASHLTRRWSGQRALYAQQLAGLNARELRYAIELAIEERWRDLGIKPRYVLLADVTHRTKEEKLGFWRGLHGRLRMFAQLGRYALRQALHSRLG